MSNYNCKVCRVLDQHGLHDYDDRLLSHWRGENGQRKGYRQLARWLNVTILRREMDKVGLPTLGDEADSKYDRLQGDNTTAAEVANLLEREGIDISGLRSDFVSYGVVRTHITECLGAEYESEKATKWEPETIEIARNHAEKKIQQGVSSLIRKQNLHTGNDVKIHLEITVECGDCQSRVPLDRALRRSRVCHCADSRANTGAVSND